MVVALLALIVAMGGSVYAASRISGTTIRKGSEPGNRLKPNSVTGKQVNEGSLGAVPDAAHAQNAARADNATHADNAAHAVTAANAGPRAYGEVTTSAPFFDATRSKNIAAVTNPMIGDFCVAFAGSGIDPAHSGAATSPDYATDDTVSGPPSSVDKVSYAEWNSDPSVCPAGQMAFRTGYSQAGGTSEGNTSANEPFFFVVP